MHLSIRSLEQTSESTNYQPYGPCMDEHLLEMDSYINAVLYCSTDKSFVLIITMFYSRASRDYYYR
jgi:hypothetical protein